jgi:hypothetical protein
MPIPLQYLKIQKLKEFTQEDQKDFMAKPKLTFFS